MFPKSFEVGDLVWAKMKGYPPWPGKIVDPPMDAKSNKHKKSHYVFFFGSENHAWVSDEGIRMHSDELVQASFTAKRRSASFVSAVEKIVKCQKMFEKGESENDSPKFQKSHESSFEKLKDTLSPNKSPHSNSVAKKDMKKKVPLKKNSGKKEGKRSLSPDSVENEFLFVPKTQKIDEEYAKLFANIPPNIHFETTHNVPVAGLLSREYIKRPETPPLDLESTNEILTEKRVVATTKKIGFLGLGRLGKGIVKNLIQSGHCVTIWDRTASKCEEYYEIGAKKAGAAENVSTPYDVFLASDITFCCVSDPDLAKTLFFGNCGILKALDHCSTEKGYVEMTCMEPKTSQAIAEQVALKGGRYLEAPISGSRLQANEGSLLVLAAGDQSLYEDCQSCFHAMSRCFIYLNPTVGSASQLNIIHNMLLGTVYAAVAESLALVKRVQLDQSDFLDILQYGILDSAMIIQKGNAMVKRDYVTNTPIKHMQRNLMLGLNLGSTVEQPMPITAAANEVYKHCKLLRYADHDVSAIYEGTSGMME